MKLTTPPKWLALMLAGNLCFTTISFFELGGIFWELIFWGGFGVFLAGLIGFINNSPLNKKS